MSYLDDHAQCHPSEPVLPVTAPGEPANPLRDYFLANQGRLIHKWMHYFDIYDAHLRPFRGRPVTLVEFGVYHGGSLQMWKHYLGAGARIIGVDVNGACKALEEPQVEIHIGDQEDRSFLAGLRDSIGPIDIVIDDGGHTMGQQIATFEEMFPAVTVGGVYLVEDLHTSYWADYGGGYREPGTFVEYAKDLIDQLHAWHSRDDRLAVDDHTRQIRAMHAYDSVIVFDKAAVSPPEVRKTGTESF